MFDLSVSFLGHVCPPNSFFKLKLLLLISLVLTPEVRFLFLVCDKFAVYHRGLSHVFTQSSCLSLWLIVLFHIFDKALHSIIIPYRLGCTAPYHTIHKHTVQYYHTLSYTYRTVEYRLLFLYITLYNTTQEYAVLNILHNIILSGKRQVTVKSGR